MLRESFPREPLTETGYLLVARALRRGRQERRYVSNATQRVWDRDSGRRVTEREALTTWAQGAGRHLLERVSDYWRQGGKRFAVAFSRSPFDSLMARALRLMKRSRKALGSVTGLKGKRSVRTGRVSDPAQLLSREARREAFSGWTEHDVRKAHLGVVASVTHAPFATALYRDADTRYPELARHAQCSVSLVKTFVNLLLQAAEPTPSAGNGWMNEAMKEGLSWEDAAWSLRSLRTLLAPLRLEAEAFHRAALPGLSGKELRSAAACWLMRRTSDWVAIVEREAERLGVDTHNLHDAVLAEAPLPAWVFETACRETGLELLQVRSTRL